MSTNNRPRFDVILKDEGSFINVGFESEKAKEIGNKVYDLNDDIFTIKNNAKSIANIIKMCNDNDLTYIEF